MYGAEFTRDPVDLDDFWSLIEKHFDLIHHVFTTYPLETREDALSGKFRGSTPTRGPAVSAIRYRTTDTDYDNRQEFYDMAFALLPKVIEQIGDREFTPAFVHNWGKLMYCHGYIASFIFDDSDDLHAVRAGSFQPRARHRLWLANQIISRVDKGTKRPKAEEEVVSLIQDIKCRNAPVPEGFERADFLKFIKGGELVSTYDAKHFSLQKMRALIKAPVDTVRSPED